LCGRKRFSPDFLLPYHDIRRETFTMSDKAVWLQYSGGGDVLPESLVIQSLRQSGLKPFRLDDVPSSSPGLVLFDRATPELYQRLREYSHNGLNRVLAIAVTSGALTATRVWNVLEAGASDAWKNTRFRLVCATNRDLTEEQAQGRFRRDFYYRIATWTCRLPPLRDRREDILPLARHFLQKLCPQQDPPALDPAVRDFLVTRDYPGNVRELRHVITRMAQRHVGNGPVTAGDIAEEDRPVLAASARKDWRDDGFELAIRRALSLGIKLREVSDAAIETAIQIAMEEEGTTLRRAATKLGVTDRALQMRRASRRRREQTGHDER
jgi:sigma-54 interacting transcriptional regulator